MDARDVLDLAWLVPALPAFGAVVLLLLGKRIGEPAAGWIATGLMFLSFAASIVMVGTLWGLDVHDRSHVTDGFTWFSSGGFVVDFRFLVDPLSSTMILFVTGVGALIHLYSIGYMHGDPRYSRFFAYLNLFAASMLVLVLGSSFLLTFLGWEGVGLCSYLLISFWFERNSAAVAGKKAFVTNRVGDFGFMLAMFLIFSKLGTLSYVGLSERASGLAEVTATAIALLLFLGAIGKSAQIPLHIWLPDAMEGPTPVSALIHAATMVTAGVFLLVRSHVFLDLSDVAPEVVAWVGALTALTAATVALVQNDIKRVLAYSTISQLGYMFLAVGVGAYGAGIFHMVTHAFFKALLFLGAGSVIHGLHHEQDMRRMGGLRRFMPVTAATFIVGWLSIAGVFPFAGFWSKDEILAKAWYHDDYGLWAVGLVAALMTAFYMTRQVWLVFFGNERWHDARAAESTHEPADAHVSGHDEREPHESPWTMTLPLVVLAALAIIGGVLSLPFTKQKLEFLTVWLEPIAEGGQYIEIGSFAGAAVLSLLALAVAIAGILAGRAVYKAGLPEDGTDPTVERLGPFARVLARAYYVDDAVAWAVANPLRRTADFLADVVDRRVIDGAVNGVGRGFLVASGALRKVQTGVVRNYALAVAIGAVALLVWFGTRVVL